MAGGGGSQRQFSGIENPQYAREFYVDSKGTSYSKGKDGFFTKENMTYGAGFGEKRFGTYAPGKYDYYVNSGEFVDGLSGPPNGGRFGNNQNSFGKLEKIVRYGLSKEGKPVVDEANAQFQREEDLISGAQVESEKKRNLASNIKKSREKPAGAGTAAGNSAVAAQGTILTGAGQQPGSLLGVSGSKSLLGG